MANRGHPLQIESFLSNRWCNSAVSTPTNCSVDLEYQCGQA